MDTSVERCTGETHLRQWSVNRWLMVNTIISRVQLLPSSSLRTYIIAHTHHNCELYLQRAATNCLWLGVHGSHEKSTAVWVFPASHSKYVQVLAVRIGWYCVSVVDTVPVHEHVCRCLLFPEMSVTKESV